MSMVTSNVLRPLIADIIVHDQVVMEVLEQVQNPSSPHTQFFEFNLVPVWAKLSI